MRPTRSVLILALLAAGCSDDVCSKVRDRFAECAEGAVSGAFAEIDRSCRKLAPIDPATRCEGGCDELTRMRAMFADCARASSCDEFGGCFEHSGCKLVTAKPGAPLELMCAPPP